MIVVISQKIQFCSCTKLLIQNFKYGGKYLYQHMQIVDKYQGAVIAHLNSPFCLFCLFLLSCFVPCLASMLCLVQLCPHSLLSFITACLRLLFLGIVKDATNLARKKIISMPLRTEKPVKRPIVPPTRPSAASTVTFTSRPTWKNGGTNAKTSSNETENGLQGNFHIMPHLVVGGAVKHDLDHFQGPMFDGRS